MKCEPVCFKVSTRPSRLFFCCWWLRSALACWFNPSAPALKPERGPCLGSGGCLCDKRPRPVPRVLGRKPFAHISGCMFSRRKKNTRAQKKKKTCTWTKGRHVAVRTKKHVDACASNQSFLGGYFPPSPAFPHWCSLLSEMTETACEAVSGQEPHSCLTNKLPQARQPNSRRCAG